MSSRFCVISIVFALAICIVGCQNTYEELDLGFEVLDNGDRAFQCTPGCVLKPEYSEKGDVPAWCLEVADTPVKSCDPVTKVCTKIRKRDGEKVCRKINFDQLQRSGQSGMSVDEQTQFSPAKEWDMVQTSYLSCSCLLPWEDYGHKVKSRRTPAPEWCYQYDDGCLLVGALSLAGCPKGPSRISVCTAVPVQKMLLLGEGQPDYVD